MIELLHAVQLRLEIGGRARPHVALDTFDIGVRAVLRRDELRLHRDVTTLPAKFDRLGVLIGLVTAERGHEKKCDRARGEDCEKATIATPGKIDPDGERLMPLERTALASPRE